MATIIIVIAAYVAVQMLADIGSLRIVLFAGLSMGAGTFVYPITFTLRDLVHKTVGAKGARVLIIAAAFINLLMAVFFAFVAALPGDSTAGDMSAFATALSPVWRIVLASIAAEVVAELIDTEAYSLWVKRMGERRQWARVLVSNAVSVPIDSALFCALAFWGTMPDNVTLSIFVSNVILKCVLTVLSIPMIYLVKEKDR